MKQSRFHGRYEGAARECAAPGCTEAGEFRAPGAHANSFDGPGDWRWLCLEHVREFNAGYDYFAGMSAEEILNAQSPIAGWARESRAFRPTAHVDGMPRWADYDDPLDAIGARVAGIRSRAERTARTAMSGRFSRAEAEALDTMGLSTEVDRKGLRTRYSELVRRYHPDRNGGDRQYEARLGRVVEAYNLLKKSRAFA